MYHQLKCHAKLEDLVDLSTKNDFCYFETFTSVANIYEQQRIQFQNSTNSIGVSCGKYFIWISWYRWWPVDALLTKNYIKFEQLASDIR